MSNDAVQSPTGYGQHFIYEAWNLSRLLSVFLGGKRAQQYDQLCLLAGLQKLLQFGLRRYATMCMLHKYTLSTYLHHQYDCKDHRHLNKTGLKRYPVEFLTPSSYIQ